MNFPQENASYTTVCILYAVSDISVNLNLAAALSRTHFPLVLNIHYLKYNTTTTSFKFACFGSL